MSHVSLTDRGLAAAITEHPHLTLHYIDIAQHGVVYTLYGDAYRSDHPDIAARIWDGAAEAERAQDPQRHGVPIIVDLQRVVAQGVRPEQNYVMER